MKKNNLVEGYTLQQIDNAFLKINDNITNKCIIHSGCGFCMAISKDCWNAIGKFDEDVYFRGYG